MYLSILGLQSMHISKRGLKSVVYVIETNTYLQRNCTITLGTKIQAQNHQILKQGKTRQKWNCSMYWKFD